jgi:hypothetical protein
LQIDLSTFGERIGGLHIELIPLRIGAVHGALRECV